MANHEPSAASQTPEFGPPNVRLEVQDFGPMAHANIQLRPLTVFVGPSNTGKTYLSLLIYALHHIFEGFPRVPLPSRRYMNFDMPLDDWRPVNISTEMLDKVFKRLTDGKQVRVSELPLDVQKELVSGMEDPELFGSDLLLELQRCFDIESESEIIRQSSSGEFRVSLNVGDPSEELWRFNMKSSTDQTLTSGHLEDILLQREGQSTAPQWQERQLQRLRQLGRKRQIHPLDWHECLMFLNNLAGPSSRWAKAVFYLPAVRGGIMQSHRIIASALVGRSTRAGVERMPQIPTFSGSVADFMRQLILYDERRTASRRAASKRVAKLAKNLEEETLSGEILITRSTTGGYPEFVYRPQGTKQDIRLNRASSMVSELAPIVLFIRRMVKPGDTLIIEEPEAHLHPAAQTQMARTLAALVRAGVRVLVTTHSDWLLQEIANLVREGELRQAQEKDSESDASSPWLDPQEVGVWLFKDSQDGGGATVKEIPFDRVDGLEPEDYADVAETLYNDSAKLQNQLELIKSRGGVAK